MPKSGDDEGVEGIEGELELGSWDDLVVLVLSCRNRALKHASGCHHHDSVATLLEREV